MAVAPQEVAGVKVPRFSVLLNSGGGTGAGIAAGPGAGVAVGPGAGIAGGTGAGKRKATNQQQKNGWEEPAPPSSPTPKSKFSF